MSSKVYFSKTISPEKVADIAKNKARAKVINHINNAYLYYWA